MEYSQTNLYYDTILYICFRFHNRLEMGEVKGEREREGWGGEVKV